MDAVAGLKYGKDSAFDDPVVRCMECQELLFMEQLKQGGCCPKCGNRRVRNVLAFSEAERGRMLKAGVDPDFLALFEATGDA